MSVSVCRGKAEANTPSKVQDDGGGAVIACFEIVPRHRRKSRAGELLAFGTQSLPEDAGARNASRQGFVQKNVVQTANRFPRSVEMRPMAGDVLERIDKHRRCHESPQRPVVIGLLRIDIEIAQYDGKLSGLAYILDDFRHTPRLVAAARRGCRFTVLRLEVVGEKSEDMTADADVHFEAVAREYRFSDIDRAQSGALGKEPAAECIVGVRTYREHVRFQPLAEQQAHVDAARIVSVEKDYPVEIVAHVLVVEDAQGRKIFHLLDRKDVGLGSKNGLAGRDALTPGCSCRE